MEYWKQKTWQDYHKCKFLESILVFRYENKKFCLKLEVRDPASRREICYFMEQEENLCARYEFCMEKQKIIFQFSQIVGIT